MSLHAATPAPAPLAAAAARIPAPRTPADRMRTPVDPALLPVGAARTSDTGADWTASAACRGADPDALFVQGAEQQQAKQVCMRCPVRTECLADALDNRVEFGVWGGMTERERRALLRRRPNVTSWHRLLDAARSEHEARARAERRLRVAG